jgi:hypothetical protein
MSSDPAIAPSILAMPLLVATFHFIGRDNPVMQDLVAFMSIRKRWWLGPIIVMLVLLGLLMVFTQGGEIAPFIYALF